MPETATFGFEFETPQTKPGITLTGDIDGSSPILAEQVDTALAGIESRVSANEGDITALQASTATDTGWLALSITLGSGFTQVESFYRRWGPLIGIRIFLTRSGADITANSAGNVAGDPVMCTLDSATFRPVALHPVQLLCSITSGGAYVDTVGQLRIADLNSSSSLRNGDNARVTTTYFLSTFS